MMPHRHTATTPAVALDPGPNGASGSGSPSNGGCSLPKGRCSGEVESTPNAKRYLMLRTSFGLNRGRPGWTRAFRYYARGVSDRV
jgi:hypothetical protein